MRKRNVYYSEIRCLNCNTELRLVIRCGVTIRQHLLKNKIKCDYCGCKSKFTKNILIGLNKW